MKTILINSPQNNRYPQPPLGLASIAVVAGLGKPSKEFDIPVIYPIHPRSRKRIQESGIHMNGSIRLIDPVDYLDSSKLECSARPVLTDSGGVQEERGMLDVPCVTMRDNTERHETVEVGASVLASGAGRIVVCASESGHGRIRSGMEWLGRG